MTDEVQPFTEYILSPPILRSVILYTTPHMCPHRGTSQAIVLNIEQPLTRSAATVRSGVYRRITIDTRLGVGVAQAPLQGRWIPQLVNEASKTVNLVECYSMTYGTGLTCQYRSDYVYGLVPGCA